MITPSVGDGSVNQVFNKTTYINYRHNSQGQRYQVRSRVSWTICQGYGWRIVDPKLEKEIWYTSSRGEINVLGRTLDDVYCHVLVHAMLSLLLHSQSLRPLRKAQIHQKASGESAAPTEPLHMRICHKKQILSFPQ